MFSKPRHLLVLLVALGLFAAACSGGDDSSSDTSLVVSSSTTAASEIEIPTVDESTGADDSTSSDESTLGATSDAELVVVLQLGPLTGLPIDASVADRPALAAKIDNVGPARPQAGLNQADIVYEERVEGGLTRLLAVFHSQDAPVLGPIRSARSTDVPILTPLQQPLFAWSGANAAFAALIRSVAIRDVGFDAQPSAYSRAADRRAPSNLMSSTSVLWDLVSDSGAPPRALNHLGPGAVFEAGVPAVGVDVSYRGTTVTHTWDAEVEGWARTQNGSPHVDTEGVQVAPPNVIVQFVDYRASGQVDSTGAVVPEAVLEGNGTIWVLSNGRILEGTWTKDNVTAPTQYFDMSGDPILLTPGSTWVLLPEPGEAVLN
ncbi:MAG: DUF3048 domain-containing protein [Actinobacteria bacterium]|nr:DUF3048 domain-containing protein [Actinomycetota bacterium]